MWILQFGQILALLYSSDKVLVWILLYECFMEQALTVITSGARLLALVGGTLSAVFIIWAGILWITASGDPQKMAQARMSLIGTVVGLVIIGIGFLVPGVISEMVIEPAGGVQIQVQQGMDCDGILRDQFVIRRAASDHTAFNQIIDVIQAQRDECDSAIWDPVVQETADFTDACGDKDGGTLVDPLAIGGMVVPGSLKKTATELRETSGRDSRNNILILWTDSGGVSNDRKPSDGSTCWLYIQAYNTWREGYGDP